MRYKWIPVLGEFSTEKDTLIFKGGSQPAEDGRLLYNVGNFICKLRKILKEDLHAEGQPHQSGHYVKA